MKYVSIVLLLCMTVLTGCNKQDITSQPVPEEVTALAPTNNEDIDANYTPPTIEEFYTEIEKRWREKNSEADAMTDKDRQDILKNVLSSHESHLESLITIEMREKAYSIVLQLVIDATQ